MTLQSPPSARKDWSYDRYFQAQINKNKNKTETKLTHRHKPSDAHRATKTIQAENQPVATQ